VVPPSISSDVPLGGSSSGMGMHTRRTLSVLAATWKSLASEGLGATGSLRPVTAAVRHRAEGSVFGSRLGGGRSTVEFVLIFMVGVMGKRGHMVRAFVPPFADTLRSERGKKPPRVTFKEGVENRMMEGRLTAQTTQQPDNPACTRHQR